MLECVLTVVVVILSLLLLLNHTGRKRKAGEAPLVKGWIPFLGKALEFGRDPKTLLTHLQNTHGDVFTLLIAGRYMTFIMDPHLYASVIKHGRHLDFHAFSDRVAPPTFGYPPIRSGDFPGLPEAIHSSFKLLQGPPLAHLTQRMLGNLLQVARRHFLHKQKSGAGPEGKDSPHWPTANDGLQEEAGMETISAPHRPTEADGVGLSSDMACDWPIGDDWQETGLYELCERLIFEASLLTLYGTHVHTHSPVAVETLRRRFSAFDRWFPLLVGGLPIWLLGNAGSMREKMIGHFNPAHMRDWKDMSVFIHTRTHVLEQHTLTQRQTGAHHFAILWAAVGNTVPAAFWVIYHLLAYPESLAAVRSQIQEVLGLSDEQELSLREDITITDAQLDQMTYLESAVCESLRLASASMNVRVATEDFELQLNSQSSVRLRKDDIIVLYPQCLHMDPEVYDQPQEYRFDRFLCEEVTEGPEGGAKGSSPQQRRPRTEFYKRGQRLRYFLMPFGSGATKCPGRFLATAELKQLVCVLVLYCRMELVHTHSHTHSHTPPPLDTTRAGLGILPPQHDVKVRYTLKTR